jgi:hypothetical protein
MTHSKFIWHSRGLGKNRRPYGFPIMEYLGDSVFLTCSPFFNVTFVSTIDELTFPMPDMTPRTLIYKLSYTVTNCKNGFVLVLCC